MLHQFTLIFWMTQIELKRFMLPLHNLIFLRPAFNGNGFEDIWLTIINQAQAEFLVLRDFFCHFNNYKYFSYTLILCLLSKLSGMGKRGCLPSNLLALQYRTASKRSARSSKPKWRSWREGLSDLWGRSEKVEIKTRCHLTSPPDNSLKKRCKKGIANRNRPHDT